MSPMIAPKGKKEINFIIMIKKYLDKRMDIVVNRENFLHTIVEPMLMTTVLFIMIMLPIKKFTWIGKAGSARSASQAVAQKRSSEASLST
eukprot:UN01325